MFLGKGDGAEEHVFRTWVERSRAVAGGVPVWPVHPQTPQLAVTRGVLPCGQGVGWRGSGTGLRSLTQITATPGLHVL